MAVAQPWLAALAGPAHATGVQYPEQPLDLDAWVYVAPGATFQLHADPLNAQWPRLVTRVDPARLWSELGRSGFAYELRQEAGPGAYMTEWPVVAMGPEKHLGYAVRWFAMALALCALYSISDGITQGRNTMGAAMNPPNITEAQAPHNRRRGRWQLLLIVAMVIGPMILATGMYKLQFWVPESRSYHGELIGNGQSRADIGVQADEKRWQILVTAPKDCTEDCQQLVYLARQIQISWAAMPPGPATPGRRPAAGRRLPGQAAARVPATATLPTGPADLHQGRQRPGCAAAVDSRPARQPGPALRRPGQGQDLLNDLRHLLKLSNIG